MTGNWLNLDTYEWEKKSSPIYNPIVAFPNKMTTWRGRPTIFGYPRCANGGVCANIEVLQYDPDMDSWIDLGDMNSARENALFVEVPKYFCDMLDTRTTVTDPTTSTATTDATSSPDTTEGTTITTMVTEDPTVLNEIAIIVGGMKVCYGL